MDKIKDSNTEKVNFKWSMRSKIAITMLCAFLIPMLLSMMAFWRLNIGPGKDGTIIIYDLRAQFMPLYASLRYLKDSDSSLRYAYFGALGNNSLPIYSSYILNPLSWITVLFPLKSLPDVLFWLTAVRIGLCGLAFSAYLFFGIKKDKHPFAICIISCCYALMSYNIAYSMCINWLDVVALTPIILIGVERILDKHKGIIYIIALTFSLYSYFQLAYIAGIFATIYLIFRLIEKREFEIKTIGKFAFCSMVSLGMFMPLFLPIVRNMLDGRFKSEPTIKTLIYVNPINVLRQFLSCSYDTIDKPNGLPNVFCGSITLVLVLLFFVFAKDIVTKLAAASIILIFMLSFCVAPLNRFWHGFNEPNALPSRFSYTLCLFLLIISYYAIDELRARINMDKAPKVFVYSVILLVVLGEQFINTSYIIASNNISQRYGNRIEYDNYVNNIEGLLTEINDDGFYRVSRDDSQYSINDGFLFGYNGISFFSSYYNRAAMYFIGSLGYAQNEHALQDKGSMPLTESIFGVKYKIAMMEADSFGYKQIAKKGNYNLYYNPNALPLGFILLNGEKLVESDKESESTFTYGDAFSYQQMFLNDLMGENSQVYKYIDYNISEITDTDNSRHVKIEFEVDEEKPIWLFCIRDTDKDKDISDVSDYQISVNGNETEPFGNFLSTTCAYIGKFEKGDRVVVDASSSKAFADPWIVYFDEGLFASAMTRLNENSLEVSSHSLGAIKGRIYAPYEESLMLITLPYMRGYNILVDGKNCEYGAYRDALVLLELGKGEHYIEISYTTPGLIIGIIIGLFSCIILLLYLMEDRITKRRMKNN